MSNHLNENSRPVLAEISDAQAEEVAQELRQDLIASVSQTGGHLASNLGMVEVTVAIHRVFDTSKDRLVFDVGHQCYPHKMLTGRRDAMPTLRQFGGISGFPKPKESIHDAFIAGHASNSVAVAMGMAQARAVLGGDYHVLALIGDGALTGGLAYEGLSNAGQCGQPMLVLLNDNGMSITRNVGGVSEHLARQRLKPQYLTFKKYYRKIMNATWLGRKVYRVTHRMKKAIKESLLPCSMFENMGFTYLGPIDGHNISQLTKTLRYAKELKEPVLIHIRTVKGKNYLPAERNPDAYHGVAPFYPVTGEPKKTGGETFSSVFGQELTKLAGEDGRICAITAAMGSGTGLSHFAGTYPLRFFDVGIAEGCGVSMAAGMAKQGAIPVFAVYSTFLQRGYDMLLHDVAIDNLHVVLAVDRAGFVGDDGETHHGVFDVGFLNTVPGITVFAPATFAELRWMLRSALFEVEGPVALRYPRGGEGGLVGECGREEAVSLRSGGDITLVSYGTQINEVLQAAQILADCGVQAEVIKLNVITPLQGDLVMESVRKTETLFVAEDCVQANCIGIQLATRLTQEGIKNHLALVNAGERFVTHGNVAELKKLLGLDGESLAKRAQEVLSVD